jgi:hypothetical protein
MDYHVEFDERMYGVPYQLVGKSVEIPATQTLVEIYYQGVMVARHMRLGLRQRYSTLKEPCPLHISATLAAAWR